MIRLLMIASVLFAILAIFFYFASQKRRNLLGALLGMLLCGSATVYLFMQDGRPTLPNDSYSSIQIHVTEQSITPNGIRFNGYISNNSDEAASLLVFQPMVNYCPDPGQTDQCQSLQTEQVRLHGHFTSSNKTLFNSFIELSGQTDIAESDYNLHFELIEAYGY